MSGEIQVKRNNAGFVVYYAPTNRNVTNPIRTKGYAEDLAQNAQEHLKNYTWYRCENGYLEYSEKASDECKGRRWGFIMALIREGVIPDVVEKKHCDCLSLTPSPVCAEGQKIYKEAEQAGTWELYIRHTRGED